VTDGDGRHVEQLTGNESSGANEAADDEPSWSADETTIAFTSCADAFGDCEIWIAGSDGGEARQLTDSRGRNSSPAWSPDGSKIAFVSDRDENGPCLFHDCTGFNGEIYVMDADGENLRRLTDNTAWEWQPDRR
jgi:Tol biopolymer transport system component